MVLALEGLSAFGAFLHVAGSVLIVYGQTTVKVAHCIEESSGAGSSWALPVQQQPIWRRPDGKWRRQLAGSKSYAAAGWALFATGNLLRFVSMRFAAQTVLSGLGSLQFVVIPIASRFLLGVKPQVSTAVGVATVLAGNLLIIINGPPEVAYSLPQLRRQWATPAMRAFLLVLGSLLLSLQLLWRHLHQRRRRAEAERRQRQQAALGGGAVGLPAGSGLETDGLLWDSSPADLSTGSGGGEHEALRTFTAALLFSAVASFIGAWSVLFSKSLTYVVTAAPESLADPYSWFTAAAFVATATYWVRQSNKGLRLYPATLIMPLMQAFWMCMSVLEGMIYFDEMAALSAPALVALMLGLIMAIIGAVAMGLSGYFNEQPHLLALAASPTALSQVEMEAQVLGGKLVSKDSGMPSLFSRAISPDGLVEATGRASGVSSPVYRSAAVAPEWAAAAAAAAAAELSGLGGGWRGRVGHASLAVPRGASPAGDDECRSPPMQYLSRDNSERLDSGNMDGELSGGAPWLGATREPGTPPLPPPPPPPPGGIARARMRQQ